MTKLSENSIKIKELINGEVCMGTYGLVELTLLEMDAEIERLKKENEISMQNAVANFIKQMAQKHNVFEGAIDISLDDDTLQVWTVYDGEFDKIDKIKIE